MLDTNSDSEYALQLEALSKSFGRPVVCNLNLAVRRGEFYALLGPNGAGKTTTLRMATGLLSPDSGRVRILGCDMATQSDAAKRCMAYLPDEPMVYDKLKPLEYLELVAGLWECDPHKAAFRASELLNLLELDQHKNELVEGFSRGMKQKLGLAGALIHEPQLIILDEPLTGLDVAAARKVKDLLLMHVRQGGTVILTTHILEVAEQLATRVGIVYQGALLVEGTLSELQSHAKREGASLESLFLTLTEMGN